MKTIAREQLTGQLNWRYATKQFDAGKKISAEDLAALEDAALLAPSSLGLQLWKFVVVQDPAVREKLRAASYGQSQITDASAIMVFASKNDVTEADIDAHLAQISKVRGVSLEDLAPLRGMAIGSVMQAQDEAARRQWAARQVYIALGTVITAAALLGIDACPMEGFSNADYNEILGLNELGYTAYAVAAVGYRSEEDKYATAPKVRYPKDQVVLHI